MSNESLIVIPTSVFQLHSINSQNIIQLRLRCLSITPMTVTHVSNLCTVQLLSTTTHIKDKYFWYFFHIFMGMFRYASMYFCFVSWGNLVFQGIKKLSTLRASTFKCIKVANHLNIYQEDKTATSHEFPCIYFTLKND